MVMSLHTNLSMVCGGGHGGRYPGGPNARNWWNWWWWKWNSRQRPCWSGRTSRHGQLTGGGGGISAGNGGPGIVIIRYKEFGGPTGS